MSDLVTAMGTAFGTIRDDVLSIIGVALPVALAIVGTALAIRLGIRYFKQIVGNN